MALNTGLFQVAPGESPKEGDARRRMAMALMQEGMSTDPIKSPWQGVANIAKSLIGGYDLGQMEAEDKRKEVNMKQGLEDQIRSLGPPEGGGIPQVAPTPSQPSMVAKSLAGGAPMSATSVDAGTKAGLYDPAVTRPPTSMTATQPPGSPMTAMASPPQAPIERKSPTISGDQMQFMLSQVDNKEMRAPLVQQLMELKKPKDQWVMEKTPEGVHYTRNLSSGEVKWAPAAPNMSVSTVADPVLKGVGEQLMDARQKATAAATESIPAIHEARRSIDQGAITGALSDPRLFISKVGSLFGLADANKIANTEQLTSALGTQLLANAKRLGVNPSNADAARIDQIVGTKNLDEKSLRELLDIQEKWARASITRHNIAAEKLMSGNRKMYEQIAPIMKIDEPGPYMRPPTLQGRPRQQAAPTAQPTPEEAAIELERRRKFREGK